MSVSDSPWPAGGIGPKVLVDPRPWAAERGRRRRLNGPARAGLGGHEGWAGRYHPRFRRHLQELRQNMVLS